MGCGHASMSVAVVPCAMSPMRALHRVVTSAIALFRECFDVWSRGQRAQACGACEAECRNDGVALLQNTTRAQIVVVQHKPCAFSRLRRQARRPAVWGRVLQGRPAGARMRQPCRGKAAFGVFCQCCQGAPDRFCLAFGSLRPSATTRCWRQDRRPTSGVEKKSAPQFPRQFQREQPRSTHTTCGRDCADSRFGPIPAPMCQNRRYRFAPYKRFPSGRAVLTGV